VTGRNQIPANPAVVSLIVHHKDLCLCESARFAHFAAQMRAFVIARLYLRAWETQKIERNNVRQVSGA